jgi:hypothetical protein
VRSSSAVNRRTVLTACAVAAAAAVLLGGDILAQLNARASRSRDEVASVLPD